MEWQQRHVYFPSKIGNLYTDTKSRTELFLNSLRFPFTKDVFSFDNETHSHNLFFQSNDIFL